MKKFVLFTLSGILAVGLLASCGEGRKNSTTDTAEPEPTAVVTEAPTAAATEEATEAPATAEPAQEVQTAEEAANDQVTIQNELDSIEALIKEGLYDDAVMQAKALMTKNLTDADKELIQEYYNKIPASVKSKLLD